MQLQRSVVWGRYASCEIIDMGNAYDRDLYLCLIECAGGITGTFHGWSKLGKSEVEPIYKKIPADDIDEEDECEKGGCYVGSIHLPSQEEIKMGAPEFHDIPRLLHHDHRFPTKIVVRIAPHDFVNIWADQTEFYQLVDDEGNVIPLDSLLLNTKK